MKLIKLHVTHEADFLKGTDILLASFVSHDFLMETFFLFLCLCGGIQEKPDLYPSEIV